MRLKTGERGGVGANLIEASTGVERQATTTLKNLEWGITQPDSPMILRFPLDECTSSSSDFVSAAVGDRYSNEERKF